MDNEPQIPPRPSEITISDSYKAFILRNLLNNNPNNNDDDNKNMESNDQQKNSTKTNSNDLTSSKSSSNVDELLRRQNQINNNDNFCLKRPNHLFKSTKKISASSDQISNELTFLNNDKNQQKQNRNRNTKQLIDWSSIDQNGNAQQNNLSDSSHTKNKEKILELFKKTDKNNQKSNSTNNLRFPMGSSTNLLPNGLTFQPNPLYQSHINNNFNLNFNTTENNIYENNIMFLKNNQNMLNNSSTSIPMAIYNFENTNTMNNNISNNNNIYANLDWSQAPSNLKTTSYSTSLPVASSPLSSPMETGMPTFFLTNQHQQAYNINNINNNMYHLSLQRQVDPNLQQRLIEQIQNNTATRNNITNGNTTNQNEDVLMPTSIYKSDDPKKIIDLFDPLREQFSSSTNNNKTSVLNQIIPESPDFEEPEGKYIDLVHSSPKKVYPIQDDILNNNNNNRQNHMKIDYTNLNQIESTNMPQESLQTIFENFKVEKREDKFNKELNEFCDHLISLYITCFTSKSNSSCDINSGLIFSPRIDIDRDRLPISPENQSDKLYLYGLTNHNDSFNSIDNTRASLSEDTSDENLIIIDVRLNALVYQKIKGHLPSQNDLAACVKALDSNYHWFSMKFPVDFDKTVDIIVTHVVYNVAGNENSEINLNDFMLKLNVANEFLLSDTRLSSYVYIQNCKKNNNHVVLELVDQTLPDFWRPFIRCETDTKDIVEDLNFKKILPKDFVEKFQSTNAEQLNCLIEELNLAFTTFISGFADFSFLKQNKNLFEETKEKIWKLLRFLSNIETYQLTLAIKEFDDNYKLIEGIDCKNESRIKEMRSKFETTFVKIVKNLINIIRIYSQMFPVGFCLPKLNQNKIQKAISFEDEDFSTKFVTLNRKSKKEIKHLSQFFTIKLDVITQFEKRSSQYNEFAVLVNLFHGFNLIDSKITSFSKLKKISSSHIKQLKRLILNQNLDFEHTLNALPRETRVEFILVGKQQNTSNKYEIDALATTFLYLYDIDEILLNGSHLLPWTELESPFSIQGISLEFPCQNKAAVMRELLENNYLVSYNLNPDAMMLVVNVIPDLPKDDAIDYCFPEIYYKESGQKSMLDRIIPFENNYENGDSLYGFYGCNPTKINPNEIKILQKNPIEQLSPHECNLIWRQRQTIKEYPNSILKLLKSPPSWSYTNLQDVYELLNEWERDPFTHIFNTKIEALQLLSMDYPDKVVRRTVVKWLNSVSVDELCDYLPQLVQALRFETSIDSHLIWALFEFSLQSARFCHYFYWQLKSCLGDRTFGKRCQIYLNSLLILCGQSTREQFQQQEKICEQLSSISNDIKQANKDSRSLALKSGMDRLNIHLKSNPTSLPLSPSLFVNGLELSQCSYFNSNSLPLKIVFNSAPPYKLKYDNLILQQKSTEISSKLCQIYESRPWWHKIIFKCGDDLRKDMLVMQIISIINRIWLSNGQNLRLIIFGVLNSSDRTGMIEMVGRASTLREIQKEYGLTGNFKPHTIATWLKSHNTDEYDYRMAILNFVHSCAGYLVITYLLGICDRHNDNIMVTTSGNLFHIDFGKFFGDAQMMVGIKRDRVPFVFTADMAYVINEGGRPSKNYQFFIDLCCKCFLIVRQNGNFLLSLLSMMIRSGIDYLSTDTIQYFHKALMPNLTDSQAKVEFNRLIVKAVGSFSTQLNFFIHTIAQSFASSGNSNSSNSVDSDLNNMPLIKDSKETSPIAMEHDEMLNRNDINDESCHFTFTKSRFTEAMDGQITRLEIIDFRLFTTDKNERTYFYKVKVDRKKFPENFVYRSFKEFYELNEKLLKTFPLVKFQTLKKSPMLNRLSKYEIAKHRAEEIKIFLKEIISMASEISKSDMIYTFFHPIMRDGQFAEKQQNANQHQNIYANLPQNLNSNHHNNNSNHKQRAVSFSSISSGATTSTTTTSLIRRAKIKLNISFNNDQLQVLICHVRNLHDLPDTYVKVYLRPDQNKSTKKKTKVISKNPHPTFMESFTYQITSEQVLSKILDVSVWESDMTGNKNLGHVAIRLSDLDLLNNQTERWFDLKKPT